MPPYTLTMRRPCSTSIAPASCARTGLSLPPLGKRREMTMSPPSVISAARHISSIIMLLRVERCVCHPSMLCVHRGKSIEPAVNHFFIPMLLLLLLLLLGSLMTFSPLASSRTAAPSVLPPAVPRPTWRLSSYVRVWALARPALCVVEVSNTTCMTPAPSRASCGLYDWAKSTCMRRSCSHALASAISHSPARASRLPLPRQGARSLQLRRFAGCCANTPTTPCAYGSSRGAPTRRRSACDRAADSLRACATSDTTSPCRTCCPDAHRTWPCRS